MLRLCVRLSRITTVPRPARSIPPRPGIPFANTLLMIRMRAPRIRIPIPIITFIREIILNIFITINHPRVPCSTLQPSFKRECLKAAPADRIMLSHATHAPRSPHPNQLEAGSRAGPARSVLHLHLLLHWRSTGAQAR